MKIDELCILPNTIIISMRKVVFLMYFAANLRFSRPGLSNYRYLGRFLKLVHKLYFRRCCMYWKGHLPLHSTMEIRKSSKINRENVNQLSLFPWKAEVNFVKSNKHAHNDRSLRHIETKNAYHQRKASISKSQCIKEILKLNESTIVIHLLE